MREFVGNLIEEKKKLYKHHYKEMISAYDRELKTISGYNGRQLLELLQNSDDEGSKDVLIKLDLKTQTISISNNGTPFTREGYESLFISDYSSKVNKKLIGNKGLGFRSIINWSNSIEIHSNDLSLTYTEENRNTVFHELFDKEQQEEFIRKRNFKDNIIPMPFLSMPILNDAIKNDYVTTIIISYKESYLDLIIKQVENITQETLLFLRNVEQIKFEGFDNVEDIICFREKINTIGSDFSPKEKIIFKEFSWYIFEEENELPVELSDSNKEGKEFYQVKIAVEENFSKSSPYLYSFFPTAIRLNQPYILHATFDLDVNRNQIDDTLKNKFILEKIIQFTVQVAKFYTKNNVSYQPLDILNHKHRADTLENLGYYDLVEKAVYSEAIFPCIDNSYKTLDEVIYLTDDFAKMLIELNAEKFINIHLLPLQEKTLKSYNIENKVDQKLEVINDIVNIINKISSQTLTVKKRALLVSQIVKEGQFLKTKYKNALDFLADKEDKIIKGSEFIYTPASLNNKLKTPEFAIIHFVNKDLFDNLIELFDYVLDEKRGKGRFIYDQLKGFCNIHSYEPATLAEKIIRVTNLKISEEPQNAITFIKEMTFCLYHNFTLMKEDTKIPDTLVDIPSISKNGNITSTKDLILSNFYPSGKKTELIFENIYTDDNYINSPQELGIINEQETHKVEDFLKWIRVNSFAYYLRNNVAEFGLNDYANYVQNYSSQGLGRGYKIKYKKINNLKNILSKLSLSKLILWIYYDDELKKQIYDSNNEDVYQFSYYGDNTISKKPSYLKYLIDINYRLKFRDLLLDEKYSWVNNFHIDYKELANYDEHLNRTIVNEILVSLGAKDDFNNLPIDKVTEIINKLPIKYPTGNKSQMFYKKALSHFEINKKTIVTPIKLFAHNGVKLKLYDQDQIYFSDKIKLPNRLRKDFPVFNYPARAGGNEAIKFFKVNDLKTISITIQKQDHLINLSADFKLYFNKLKPFILTYRINAIEDVKVQKTQASLCNKIEIKLCSNIDYSVQNNNYEVADYEFLHYEEQVYFIKVNQYDTVNSLRKNSLFTNTVADIISLVFDVSGDKSEFKYLIRSDYEDVQNTIKSDFGEDILNEARELLGLADYKQAFWQAVLVGKDLIYDEQLDDFELEQYISNEFNIDYDTTKIDYENINEESELLKIESLFAEINLSLKNFARNYVYKIDLSEIHFKNIKNAILSRKKLIKTSIWKSLSNESIANQALYLNEINKYENYQDFALKLSDNFKFHFKIELSQIAHQYIDLLYPNLKIFDSIDLETLKSENLKNFTTDEQFDINQNERHKSLIHFTNAIETIKLELNSVKINSEITSELNSDDYTNDSDSKPRLFSSENLKPKLKGGNANSTKGGVFTPKERNGRKLKEMGNTSEKIVYDYMIDNNFKDVDPVSKDNEGLHYDIRYTDENGVVKFVEVKTFDNGSFHMSKAEFDFGENNKEDFEIWLVKNKLEIIPIKDFFINKKYITSVNEYLIHLELIN